MRGLAGYHEDVSSPEDERDGFMLHVSREAAWKEETAATITNQPTPHGQALQPVHLLHRLHYLLHQTQLCGRAGEGGGVEDIVDMFCRDASIDQ